MHHKKKKKTQLFDTSCPGMAEESKTTMLTGLFYTDEAKIYDTIMTSISTTYTLSQHK